MEQYIHTMQYNETGFESVLFSKLQLVLLLAFELYVFCVVSRFPGLSLVHRILYGTETNY